MTIRPLILPLIVALLTALAPAAAFAQHAHHDHAAHHRTHADSAADSAAVDTAFAALQARGHEHMGVDQYTSTHRFDALPDGGRIELRRDTGDARDIATIRSHLRGIAEAFAAGDFGTPAAVHARAVPGTEVMAARRTLIRYTYRDLPRGGEVRIVTADPQALVAIHAFVAFQREDHRAGGASH